MAGKTIKAKPIPKGKRMSPGSGWRLATTKGEKREFAATLLQTINIGKKRIAIFSVPKRFG
jgi:hypothetical protein